jgi:hypothetical protein
MTRRICRRRVRATTRAGRTGRPSASNDDPLRRQIYDVEQALWREDPAFMSQVRRLQRVDTAYVLTIYALLAAGSVLFTVGVATSTIVAGGVGVLAMAAACLIDRRHQRALRRSPRDDTHPDRLDRPTGHRRTRHRGG